MPTNAWAVIAKPPSMKALESTAPLIVYIDVKSPYAFVAIKPTLALEQILDCQFDWRPLTLDIPSYLGSAEKRDGVVVSSEGRSERTWRSIRQSYREARRYAERQGHVLKGTEKIWDSSIANIGILWVMQHRPERLEAYLETVYPPFWQRLLDIEEVSVVADCLERAGIGSAGFDAFQRGEGRAQHDQLAAQLHPAGLFGVPSYVLDGEVFFGREHLPYLRWCLTGKQGQAPDVAYDPDGGIPC